MRADKGSSDFEVLWADGRNELAINNARRLRKSRGHDTEQTAYTDVDLVLDALRKAAFRP